MRVLQLISSGGMYGAEAVILNLARCLEASGHHSVLGIFANGDIQLHRAATERQLESHLLPCAGQFDPRMVAQLRRIVREHAIEIVHAHGYKADVYAYVALRGAGIPLVSTCHNWLDTDSKVRAYGMLDRLVLRRFHAVAVVSTALQTRLCRDGFDAKKLHLISNGIDIAPFHQAAARAEAFARSGQSFRIGIVGRLSQEKGVDLFLEAAAIVLEDEPEVQFVIVGEGPERETLESLAAHLGIEQHVRFLGRSDAMPALLASLDLLVSASRLEGLPMTILESMASGRPIIATTVGEIPTVLDGGRAGMLVPPEDSSALAQAMLTMLEHAEVRNAFAQEAASRVRTHFSADQMTAHYLRMYKSAQMTRSREP